MIQSRAFDIMVRGPMPRASDTHLSVRPAAKTGRLKSSLGKTKAHASLSMPAIERTRRAGLAEDPPCLFVLSAKTKTIHNLGIRDYSLGKKGLSSPSMFGQFAFG